MYFFIRKLDKSELGREIKKNMRNIMSAYATQDPPDSMPVTDVFHQMDKLCYIILCRRVGTVYGSFLRAKY